MAGAPTQSDSMSLHAFLSDLRPRLRIPEFQRHYVWGQSELKRFWKDFTVSWKGEGATPYFLGAVVLHRTADSGAFNPAKYDVIDGQQRLLTLYLTLVAIAEAFQHLGADDLAADVEREYLLLQKRDYKHQPAIVPAIDDTRQFNSTLIGLNAPNPVMLDNTGEADGELQFAWQWLRKKIRNHAKDTKSETGLSRGRLEDLYARLVEHSYLVVIEVTEKRIAHQIFERLNRGGKRLDDIDLVRNAVFSELPESDPVAAKSFYTRHWDPFEQSLDALAREYWYPLSLMRDPEATKAGAFATLQQYWWNEDFSKGLTGPKLSERIMDDLNEYREPFRAITGLGISPELDAASRRALRRLHRLEVPTMTYDFFFGLIRGRLDGDVDADRFVLFCEIVESAIVRRVLRGIEMSAIQGAFKGRWNAHLDPEEFLTIVVDRMKVGSDDELVEGVKRSELYNMKRCAYILTEHERWFTGGQHLVPSDSKAFHVDHVLPQRPAWSEWPRVDPAEHEALKHSWGNLVLLPPKLNHWKSAKGYEEARIKLTQPGQLPFRSTGQVLEENRGWSIRAIRKRSAEMADWAGMRWPREMEDFLDPQRRRHLDTAG